MSDGSELLKMGGSDNQAVDFGGRRILFVPKLWAFASTLKPDPHIVAEYLDTLPETH